MQYKTAPYKFDDLYAKIENSRSGAPKFRGSKYLTARSYVLNGKRQIIFKHHNTEIAAVTEYSGGNLYVYIDAQGWRSATTKHYLNEILRAYNTGARITQKDFEWWVDDDPYTDGLVFWGFK